MVELGEALLPPRAARDRVVPERAAQIAQQGQEEGDARAPEEGAHHQRHQRNVVLPVRGERKSDAPRVQGGEVRDEGTEEEGEQEAEAE